MTVIFLIIVFLSVFFIIGNILRNIKFKKITIKYLNSSYGKKPSNSSKTNFDFLGKYYKERINYEKSNHNYIDNITWNDLDMNTVFKRINYTKTTLGETYLYYKLKKINYNKLETEKIENLISIFEKNCNLRNTIGLNLMKISKFNNETLINFIYNPMQKGIDKFYIYPVLSIVFIISILLSCFNIKIGFILLFLSFCTNAIFYQKGKIQLQDNIYALNYLFTNISICNKFTKIINDDFNQYKTNIKNILKKCKNLSKARFFNSMISDKDSASFDAHMFLELFRMFFMTQIISYEIILKILHKNTNNFLEIYKIIAEIDVALSICYYRKSLKNYCIPTFTKEATFKCKNLYHPLVDNCIENSIHIKNGCIFTGSNASGKSTFIKSIALNIILSQNINTSLCSEYIGKFSKVVTSMSIKDNVLNGDSYFIAEIKSLKRLLDSTKDNIYIIAFVDEILKGTNTLERIAASTALLKYASKCDNITILTATHDMEITELLNDCYTNYHFSENIIDNNIYFDYKLKEGPSNTTNALKLLEIMDFDSEIINTASHICYNLKRNKPIL